MYKYFEWRSLSSWNLLPRMPLPSKSEDRDARKEDDSNINPAWLFLGIAAAGIAALASRFDFFMLFCDACCKFFHSNLLQYKARSKRAVI